MYDLYCCFDETYFNHLKKQHKDQAPVEYNTLIAPINLIIDQHPAVVPVLTPPVKEFPALQPYLSLIAHNEAGARFIHGLFRLCNMRRAFDFDGNLMPTASAQLTINRFVPNEDAPPVDETIWCHTLSIGTATLEGYKSNIQLLHDHSMNLLMNPELYS